MLYDPLLSILQNRGKLMLHDGSEPSYELASEIKALYRLVDGAKLISHTGDREALSSNEWLLKNATAIKEGFLLREPTYVEDSCGGTLLRDHAEPATGRSALCHFVTVRAREHAYWLRGQKTWFDVRRAADYLDAPEILLVCWGMTALFEHTFSCLGDLRTTPPIASITRWMVVKPGRIMSVADSEEIRRWPRGQFEDVSLQDVRAAVAEIALYGREERHGRS